MQLISMLMVHWMLMVNAIVFGILCVIWSKDNWLNFFFKVLFLALMVFAILAFFSTKA